MNNNSNLIAAIVLSLAVLFGFQYFYAKPKMEAARAAQVQAQLQGAVAPASPDKVADKPAVAAPERDRETIIAEGFAKKERVKIETSRLHGSLNLRGGRIDDLRLADYHDTPDVKSPEVVLLSPSGTAEPQHAYYAEFGWLADKADLKLPGEDTLWQTSATTIGKDAPIVLTWNNGAGLTFERTITLDNNFMFAITDKVTNANGEQVTLFPYSLVSRHAIPPLKSMYILHEGPLGVFDGRLTEVKYHDLQEEKQTAMTSQKGGWLGLTDKYWLVAIAPDQTQPVAARFTAGGDDNERFQADARGAATVIAAGGSASVTTHFFAGAKEVRQLEMYQDKLGIEKFDLAVDFGWFYFLTKPYFHALNDIASYLKDTGYGFGFAILIFTIILKLAFFPLQAKSYKSMARMRAIQPRMVEIRERWANDRQRMNMETFELYRREKINPMSGCWPMLVQIPVFFALYKVLYVTIEMRHAPFPGWVFDLSAPDPTSVFNLFGLIPLDLPHFLHIGVWPILMGLTMFLQQRLSPPPGDPVQQMMFRWMPVFFTVLLASFPVGLVIYWTWSNTLGIAQQYYLTRKVAHEKDASKDKAKS